MNVVVTMGRAWICVLMVSSACGGGASERETQPEAEPAVDRSQCPASAPAPSPLPNVEAAQRTLAYWLERTPNLDEVVLDIEDVRAMNASLVLGRRGWNGEFDLAGPVDRARVSRDVARRLEALHGKIVAGELVDEAGARPADARALDPAGASELAFAPELRVALAEIPIRCGPRLGGLYSKPAAGAALSKRFDRNSCSTIHPQEVIQILSKWRNGMYLARTRYAIGWIAGDAKLSPAVPEALRDAFVHGPRVQADEDLALRATGAAARCPAGTLLPLGAEGHVRFASATGFHEAAIADDEVQVTRRPLTRRALLSEAFRFLDGPYGWGGGGAAGGHDCSAFMMDLFGAFDIRLPRHSSWQARAGTFSIDVSKVTSEAERARLFDAAAEKGVVLLSFPGHVMLYLGRSERGTPMVMHAIAEYAAACKGGGETIYEIDKITVSDLELGRGSSRRALIERITTITVFGKAPGVELAGAAELRPAAPVVRPPRKACRDSQAVAMFSSPRIPNVKQPLRVIVTANRDLGASELALFDPAGQRVTPKSVVKLAGGPPWSVIATVDAPAAGAWTAVLGDGAHVDACQRIAVRRYKPRIKGEHEPTAPAWEIRRAWTRATENLYSTFVQRLFDFPADQDVTWPDLHTLLRDPSHNILFDYLQRGEEGTLELQPDCADLPYLLRSYFAWKLGLPFAYHRCTRGSANRAPLCKPPFYTNLMERDLLDDKLEEGELAAGTCDPETGCVASTDPDAAAAADLGWEASLGLLRPEETDGIEEEKIEDVDAFAMFWARHVARGVHAASGRTRPDDDDTDYYPVPLTRETLKPGTVYIDPFGHVMVVAAWVPQSATSYGVLLAADAQPDGTVGRKRFWRGNFLMSTETRVSGAGFKAFRPVVYDRKTKQIEQLDNKKLRRSRVFPPFSRQQYEGSVDTFYDAIEGLVNPRPLDPFAALNALVDSLYSQAKLRVISVKNGEGWVAANPGKVMEMPDGADIFLTSGPWEDFATPSRDFRLLIAIDTVLGFPAAVRRAPARFAVDAAAVDATIAKLEQELDRALRARTIAYVRSDGANQTVTLRDVVDRRAGFEMSYNPNDCVEIRWAAPEGSPERESCRRHAPAEQLAKMTEYRAWFHDRRRPAR